MRCISYAVALITLPVLILSPIGCVDDAVASSPSDDPVTASPPSEHPAAPEIPAGEVGLRCISKTDDTIAWEFVLSAHAGVSIGVQNSKGLGHASMDLEVEPGVYRLSYHEEKIKADTMLEALSLMDARATTAITTAAPGLKGASIRRYRTAWGSPDGSSSSSNASVIGSSAMTAADHGRAHGSQRSTEEKLQTVPVGERVWLSFHWTGPIESTAGTSHGVKHGGGELRLIETQPGGEVIDHSLADYPHPAWGMWIEFN
jgi:hypothetical protein